MYLIKPPLLVRSLCRDFLWSVNTNEREVYLTFDDGPTHGVTEKVLQLLDNYNAKATFFCLGKNVNEHSEIYNKIIAKGHATGNHTWDHPDGWKCDEKSYLSNVDKASAVINSKLFRPPYGRIKPGQTRRIQDKFKIVMWDVLSADFDPDNSPEKCFTNVTKNASSGSIVVFHDNLKSQKNMIPALEKSLQYFASEGYTLRHIPV